MEEGLNYFFSCSIRSRQNLFVLGLERLFAAAAVAAVAVVAVGVVGVARGAVGVEYAVEAAARYEDESAEGWGDVDADATDLGEGAPSVSEVRGLERQGSLGSA